MMSRLRFRVVQDSFNLTETRIGEMPVTMWSEWFCLVAFGAVSWLLRPFEVPEMNRFLG
jgi:hypothetical protein